MEQVSKEMMDEFVTVKNDVSNFIMTPSEFLDEMKYTNGDYGKIHNWYSHSSNTQTNKQLKLIKHIWLNDPQFEEEKPKKYIVRALDNANNPWYINENSYGIKSFGFCVYSSAFRFDTRKEAEKYSTPQAEVIEVEE